MQHLKLGSDRPDIRLPLTWADGEPVDLSNATGAQLRVHAPDGTTVVDAAASILAPYDGLVSYDVSADEFSTADAYDIEVRIDWADGDEQWFPIEQSAYELTVVAPPYDRPETIGATTYGETTYGDTTYGE